MTLAATVAICLFASGWTDSASAVAHAASVGVPGGNVEATAQLTEASPSFCLQGTCYEWNGTRWRMIVVNPTSPQPMMQLPSPPPPGWIPPAGSVPLPSALTDSPYCSGTYCYRQNSSGAWQVAPIQPAAPQPPRPLPPPPALPSTTVDTSTLWTNSGSLSNQPVNSDNP